MSLYPQRVPTRDEVLAVSSKPIPAWLRTSAGVLAILGAIVFIIGLFVAPQRVWLAFHFNWLFFAMLTVGGLVLVAAQRITTARWSRSTIRFAEGFVAFQPIAFIFLLITLFAGKNYVLPWTHEVIPATEKVVYFNEAFMYTRDIFIFGVFTILSLWYIYLSLRLDVGQLPEAGAPWAAGLRARMRKNWRGERRELHSIHSVQGRISVWMALIFGFGFSVIAWDLSMGLDLHFQSTIYSWWFFMGGWLCGISALSLLTAIWDRHLHGAGGLIEEVNYHDLGKLIFAFTAFWGYLTFDQYLVIWYGNLGEETHFMRLRLVHPWMWVTVTSVFLAFAVPFFGFLSRATKVFRPTFVLFALCSLVGMWGIRYIEMYPSALGVISGVPFGIWEIGVTALYLGLFAWVYIKFFDAFPRMRVTLMTSPSRDEVQIPVDARTMEPLPAHE